MPQSLAKILVHVVFSTKSREPMIACEIKPALHAYIIGILENLCCPSVQTGGTADHVHTLLSLARTWTVADVVEEVKKSSSKWMKPQGDRELLLARRVRSVLDWRVAVASAGQLH